MSRSRRVKRNIDLSACIPGNDTTFGMIYYSMTQHKSFQSLSNPAKLIYMFCRVQHASKAGRACLYKHSKESGFEYPSECFVFPSKHQKVYGIKDRSNFRKYMCELIDKGFINRYENNQHRRKVTVYAFSQKWKDL